MRPKTKSTLFSRSRNESRRLFGTLSLLLVLPATGSLAQSTKSKAPASPPKTSSAKQASSKAMTQNKTNLPALTKPNALKLPEIVQKELENGLKLVILEDHSQPALWLRLALPAGTIRDPKDKIGLAQLTAAMLDKGTQTRTETQIADKIDGLGASLGAGTDSDFMTISATGLSVYHDTLFELLSDISLRPTFPKEELERVRTQTINSVTSALGDAGTVADAVARRVAYGEHPYGNFASGTEKSLSAITKEDLLQYHDSLFAPNVATLFIVGDITPAEALKQAEDSFGGWKRHDIPALPKPPKASSVGDGKPQITIIDRPGAAQTQIRIAQLTPGYNDPQRVAARVASAVLGLGQFESRLMKEIRVKRGLTYGAGSSFARNSQAGVFEIGTFTKNNTTGEVTKIALAEANKLTTDPIPGDELEDRKAYLNGFFSVSVATTPGVLNRLIPATLYGAGATELTQYTGKVQQITNSQIREVMNSLNLKNVKIVLVGDAKEIEAQVQSIGTITKISAGEFDLASPNLKTTKQIETKPVSIPKSDPAAEELMMSALKAHGGDAFLKVKSLVMRGKGELTPPGQTITLPVESATLTFVEGKGRIALKTGFGEIIFASSGKGKGWLNAMGNLQDTPATLTSPTEILRLAANGLAAKDGSYSAALLPDIADAEGKSQQGFSLTDSSGKTTSVYLDKETHLLRRTFTGDGKKGMNLSLSEYKAFEGVMAPGNLKIFQGEKILADITLTEYVINKPVDEKQFEKPVK